jgi:hypothetical protein
MIAGAGPQVGAGARPAGGWVSSSPPVGIFARAESDVSVLGAGSGWSILSPIRSRQLRRAGGRIAVPPGAPFASNHHVETIAEWIACGFGNRQRSSRRWGEPEVVAQ